MTAEPVVAVFPDDAVELARIIEVFLEFAARRGDMVIADLSDIAYGDHVPGYVDWTEESLTWAGRMALALKQQAASARSTIGEQR